MPSIPSRSLKSPHLANKNVTALIPDFPFHYGQYLDDAQAQARPLCQIDPLLHGTKTVLVVGAGVCGMVAAYELMKMGLHPVVVEATDRIGGRLYSVLQGDPANPDKQVICELGAMRFPASGKALFHYFKKVGMNLNSAPFPNPGSDAAVSTVVDFKGTTNYYENQSEAFPKPAEYVRLETEFFENFVGGEPFNFEKIEAAMTEGTIDQALIKQLWNGLLKLADGRSWDDVSFYAALLQESGWSKQDIDLFGQIGFGTGGWNTNYPNSILELLRVLYTGLDADHALMYDGSSTLPQKLWSSTARDLGDACVEWANDKSVESLSKAVLATPFNQEVRDIKREADGGFSVLIQDNSTDGQADWHPFDFVVYTPHVRILDKMRYANTPQSLNPELALLPAETWEAIMNTHYMQSAKIFAATTSAFWNETPPEGSPRKMSVTLSDRLTRGTYLVDYGDSRGKHRGSGIYLSYTWNDDALKFLGDRASLSHAQLCTTLLENIYPDIKLGEHFSTSNAFIEYNWEDQPFHLGAFKMNLPGHYEYQRRIFSQFMTGVAQGNPDGFVLAGDDVSWTGGWAEGAVSSAINAVNKIAVCLGGGSYAQAPGPVESWEALKPIDLNN